MANFFDQFDAPVAAPQASPAGGNFFDQFDAPPPAPPPSMPMMTDDFGRPRPRYHPQHERIITACHGRTYRTSNGLPHAGTSFTILGQPGRTQPIV